MKQRKDHLFASWLQTLFRRTSPAELLTTSRQTSALTQQAAILAHLSKGEELTTTQAIEKYGCFRLSARIWELRTAGYPIITRRIKGDNGKYVAAYRLVE